MQSHKSTLRLKLQESQNFFEEKGVSKIDAGLILGTGLGDVADMLSNRLELEVDACPHLSASTALAHRPTMSVGNIGSKKVLVFEGRRHLYEGCTMEEIVMPIYILKTLGAKEVIMTNAAGGLNPSFEEGDLMIMDDYINFMGASPLEGVNDDSIGSRFPDMIEPYDKERKKHFLRIATNQSIRMHQGIFCGVRGPQLETRAEYRMLRGWGCDAVGMSTVPETIAANHVGMKAVGIACITDICTPESLSPVDIPKILSIAKKAGPAFQCLIQYYFEGKFND